MDLISAAKNGDFESVFSLLQNGCSTELQDKDKATPLYWSACHGHTNICETLIQAGSDVNTRVTWGSTPLHAAADRGHNSAIDVLIER
jgi:ankyrin repeat protein